MTIATATPSGGTCVVYLREFARPDGTLPTEFDALVRESFGELLAGRAQVTLGVLQRSVALAAVALLAAVAALALSRETSGGDTAPGEATPVTVEETGWYTALAGSRGAPSGRRADDVPARPDEPVAGRHPPRAPVRRRRSTSPTAAPRC